MSRPEHILPPELYYNEQESERYAQNSRILEIQQQLSERAYELLGLPNDNTPRLLLDLGCGSGISGQVLADNGNLWVGMDISEAMLRIAQHETEEDKNCAFFLQDLGQGLPFRPGSFDGVVSVSVLQWLCNADKTSHNPYVRIRKFFTSLLAAMTRGARAVFQFYPENAVQIEMLSNTALKCGFGGGLVVDFPNSKKAKKYYLVLNAGYSNAPLPLALGDSCADDEDVQSNKEVVQLLKHKINGQKRGGKRAKGKEWIMHKKDLARHRGKENIPHDSKYTGRKRKGHF